MFFTSGGGPTISVSVGFPKPYDAVSITFDFGTISPVSEKYVEFPSKLYYYRVKCSQTYEVCPYIVYRRQTSTDPWYEFSGGVMKTLIDEDYWAEKVK